MPLQLAFLNCYNLYEPSAHSKRGPRTQRGYTSKLSNLAGTIRQAAGNQAPDVVGLCEVGSEQAARDLAQILDPGTYAVVWSDVPSTTKPNEPQPGLVILYKFRRISRTISGEMKDSPQNGKRHKWIAVEFQLGRKLTDIVWIVVNHWTSDYKRRVSAAEALRVTSAKEIGMHFLSLTSTSAEAVILLGDFNCEPFARPFVGDPRTDRLYAVRERALVIRPSNQLMYAYNPMWRRMGEPDDYEVSLQNNYVASRPMGTYPRDKKRQSGWQTLDQIMLTKRLMTGGPLQLLESSLRVHPPMGNCSDHHAVCVSLT